MIESLIKVLWEFRGRKDHSLQGGVFKGSFLELVAELGLEGWTKCERWRLDEGIPAEVESISEK